MTRRGTPVQAVFTSWETLRAVTEALQMTYNGLVAVLAPEKLAQLLRRVLFQPEKLSKL